MAFEGRSLERDGRAVLPATSRSRKPPEEPPPSLFLLAALPVNVLEPDRPDLRRQLQELACKAHLGAARLSGEAKPRHSQSTQVMFHGARRDLPCYF